MSKISDRISRLERLVHQENELFLVVDGERFRFEGKEVSWDEFERLRSKPGAVVFRIVREEPRKKERAE